MSVFGALNRFISRLDSDGPNQAGNSRHAAAGFQVLRNKKSDIPIEPWYDFIVGINGRLIDNINPHLFATEIRNCAGSSVTLTVWNAKGQQLRELSTHVPSDPPTLGLTLQWAALSSTEDVWHILEVIPDSPADNAGMLPYGDYVVGTPEGALRGESGLRELVEDYLSRPLRLYVYNHEYGVTRLVTITPSRNWGGEGALGCVLGYGALHRLPPSLNEPPAAPGETLFETAQLEGESGRQAQAPATQKTWLPASDLVAGSSAKILVPEATSLPPSRSPPVTSTPARGPRRKRPVASPNSAFDQVWKESEERSKEEDFVPKSKPAAVPPPPPQEKLEVQSGLPVPPLSGGEPRQTRSPDPIIDDDDE